jgi:hypothetical protein
MPNGGEATNLLKKWGPVSVNHRDILIEATSSQKVCATSISTDYYQCGAPTLGQWPLCCRIWNEIDIFQISDKNINYASNHLCNILRYNCNNF